ncbi:hypothetical protein FVE85_6543 [Porphyridium purpureum]|uniref:Uncharacterized protein n=1 Tax=Porphyridium purpureum TaxID=35688 RepID=A0A5J4Z6W9_PORPP|nr:hypothetical protein FVE85_6543 [Porphyridium purpureum]|eukprot:POR2519..scf295_1
MYTQSFRKSCRSRLGHELMILQFSFKVSHNLSLEYALCPPGLFFLFLKSCLAFRCLSTLPKPMLSKAQICHGKASAEFARGKNVHGRVQATRHLALDAHSIIATS